jgi:hypothetical protein
VRCSPFGGQHAFDGGFEDAGPIALEVGPRPLQCGHASIEVGEEFLNLLDDPALLVDRSDRHGQAQESPVSQVEATVADSGFHPINGSLSILRP